MNKNHNYIVIMAGGKGTRLWPMSRNSKPKQLQKLVSEKTMIEETYERIKLITPPSHIYISTNDNYKKEIQKQLPELSKNNYIIEPIARNTAPAIGLIAISILHKDPKAIITTIASDHSISDTKQFINSVKVSQKIVHQNPKLIGTIGIKPTFAHTGLGYIEKGKLLKKVDGTSVYFVKQFVEKPDKKTAQKYLNSGQFFWNANYPTFNAQEIINYIKQYEPEIYKHIEIIQQSLGKKNEKQVIKKQFSLIPELAIDYLLEKLNSMFIVPTDFGMWDDVGSWEAIKDILSKSNRKHNVERGHHIGVDNEGCLIYAHNKLVSTIGLRDIVIVDTEDAILICDKKRSQDVKKIIEKLQSDKKYHKYL